jgi:hypothetical protein
VQAGGVGEDVGLAVGGGAVVVADAVCEAGGLPLGVLVAGVAVRLDVGVVSGIVGDGVALSVGDGVTLAVCVGGIVPVTVAVGIADRVREAVGLLLGVPVTMVAPTLDVGVVPGVVGATVAVSVGDGSAVTVCVDGTVPVSVAVGVATATIPPQKPPLRM